jgi:hypothetical protein
MLAGMVEEDFGSWDQEGLDEEAFLDAWDAADHEAAVLLRSECAEVLAEPAPHPDLALAAGALRRGVEPQQAAYPRVAPAHETPQPPDLDDEELWLTAAEATISLELYPGMDVEDLSAVAALQHADWYGMVAGLVRRGTGASFDEDSVRRDIDALTDVADDFVDDGGVLVGHAVALLAPLWEALGILDDDERLTPLGRWGLPRALVRNWEAGEGDTGGEPDLDLDG